MKGIIGELCFMEGSEWKEGCWHIRKIGSFFMSIGSEEVVKVRAEPIGESTELRVEMKAGRELCTTLMVKRRQLYFVTEYPMKAVQ